MKIVRRDQALADLADCAFYIAEDDPAVADRFVDAFELSVERLVQMPYIGVAHPTGNPALFGMRRWPIKGFEKYLIFYLAFEDIIDVVRILHSSQDVTTILKTE